MADSNDTIYRHWYILQWIPRYPRKVDAATLHRRLEERGFKVTVRSVQRDLQKLEPLFSLQCDEENKPYGWSFPRDGSGFEFPSMSLEAALTFRLMMDYAAHLLPHTTVDYLRGHLERANRTLELSCGFSQWVSSVRTIPQGQPQLAPEVDGEVLKAVYAGLFEGRCLEIAYLRPQDQEPRDYLVHPLGLVVRDRIIYLVCTFWSYSDVVHIAVHRIRSAVLLEDERVVSEGFDLDALIASGALSFLVEPEPIVLEMRVASPLERLLAESPLGPDQIIEADGEGWCRLRVQVPYTKKLQGWLLGYGALVQVVGPASLRRALVEEVRAMAAHYLAAEGA